MSTLVRVRKGYLDPSPEDINKRLPLKILRELLVPEGAPIARQDLFAKTILCILESTCSIVPNLPLVSPSSTLSQVLSEPTLDEPPTRCPSGYLGKPWDFHLSEDVSTGPQST